MEMSRHTGRERGSKMVQKVWRIIWMTPREKEGFEWPQEKKRDLAFIFFY